MPFILRKPSYQVNSPRPQLSGLRGALQTCFNTSTFVKQLQRNLALCGQALGNVSAILAEPTSVPAPRGWL